MGKNSNYNVAETCRIVSFFAKNRDIGLLFDFSDWELFADYGFRSEK